MSRKITKEIGSTLNDDGWKVVTRTDKKRVIRNSRTTVNRASCSTAHVASRQCNIGSQESLSLDSDIDSIQLHQALKACCEYIQQTDLFQEFTNAWEDYVKTSIENETTAIIVVREIICYGIGNFSVTSLSHYNASLWQLAFVLSIRKFLSTSFHTEKVGDNGTEANGNIKDGDVTQERSFGTSTTASSRSNISITYYDPCTTLWEKEFLHQNIDRLYLVDDNERGKRPIYLSDNNQRMIDPATNLTKNVLLFFMPHCPAQLYENVAWSHWDYITIPDVIESLNHVTNPVTLNHTKIVRNTSNVIMIGNSLLDIAERKYYDGGGSGMMSTKPKLCLQTLLPWLQQRPIRTSHQDTKQFPGNIVGAFNDTYLSYWTRSSLSNDKNGTLCQLQRPIDDRLVDDLQDLELY
jgi:SRR1